MVQDFNAPKEAVFKAFASADALGEWWGPAGTKNSVLSLDFREGGIFHFQMEHQGKKSYGRFVYKKIQPNDLLEFTNAFADEKGNPIPAPFDVKLPIEILYRLRFTENNGKTTITLTGQPVAASREEEEGFRSLKESMKEGFGGTFHQLEEYLEKIRTRL